MISIKPYAAISISTSQSLLLPCYFWRWRNALSGWVETEKGVQNCQWTQASGFISSRLKELQETWCQYSRVFLNVNVFGGRAGVEGTGERITWSEEEFGKLWILAPSWKFTLCISIFKALRNPASKQILIYPSISQTNMATDTFSRNT